jgi:hypothetical protein
LSISKARGRRYDVCTDEGRPKWLRPVSSFEHGQVPENFVVNINLLDIVGFRMVAEVPEGFQAENIQFDNRGFHVSESLPAQTKFLDKLITPKEYLIFGNPSNLVSKLDAQQLSYSLVFIQPLTWNFFSTEYQGRRGFRVIFTHENIEYNLPITDIHFCERLLKEPEFITKLRNVYLTISLGQEFRDCHYKLVAGVIGIE